MGNEGWLDLPLYRFSPKRFPKPRGMNLVPMERLLKHDYFFHPVGLAIQKEFGKRLSFREYMEKSKVAVGKKGKAFPFDSMGMQGILTRLNRRIKKQMKNKRRRRK